MNRAPAAPVPILTPFDDQKKHPVPYLYMAKAYLAIHNSDDSDLRESYEVDKMKALKNIP